MSSYPPPGNYPPFQPPGSPPIGFGPPGFSPYPPQSRTQRGGGYEPDIWHPRLHSVGDRLGRGHHGHFGIRDTRTPGVGGRGMAVAGLVLGIINLLAWPSIGGMLAWTWHYTAPERMVGRQFITDLSAGNVDAAAKNTNNIPTDQLQKTADQLKAWGTPQITLVLPIRLQDMNGTVTGVLQADMTYPNSTSHEFFLNMSETNGVWKVDSYTSR